MPQGQPAEMAVAAGPTGQPTVNIRLVSLLVRP
jgi:hypothetical protein